MRKLLLSALLLVSFGFAQEETYQVPGFPPFAPAPTMLEVAEDRGDTVVVRHAYGETEIPKSPERVLTDHSTLEAMLALGIQPVASYFFLKPEDTPPDLARQLEGMTLLEVSFEPNPEAVLSVAPDVIVVANLVLYATEPQRLYDQLSRIAPTIVLVENAGSFWEASIRDLGAVFGLDDDVRRALEAYEQDAEAQCERIRQVIGDGTLSMFNAFAREVQIFGPGYETTLLPGVGETTQTGYIPYSPTAWAYKTCRLTPGPEVERLVGIDEGAFISLEILPEIEADHLLVMVREEGAYDFLSQHPLWERVPAVQQGQVYTSGLLTVAGPYTSLWAIERAAVLITGETN
jgi:iron complex transport system substrate-binding protein